MKLPLVCTLLAAATVMAGTGCSTAGTVVRSQTPGPAESPVYANPDMLRGPVVGTAPGYGQFHKHGHHDFRAINANRNPNFGYYDGSEYSYGGFQDAGGACPPEAGGHGCPHNYNSYRYDWPQNSVYPTTGAPNAAIQYPYYTLRGPTDFFMK